MMGRPLLGLLFLLVPCVAAQNVTDCSKTLAQEMGTGGGGLMFFLGFITGALVIGVIWLLMDQRWKSWHVFNRAPAAPAAPTAGYAPLYPQAYTPADPSQPGMYVPQQPYVWPAPVGYQTQYEVVRPFTYG